MEVLLTTLVFPGVAMLDQRRRGGIGATHGAAPTGAHRRRAGLLVAAAAAVLACGDPSGQLEFTVVDEAGRTTPARIELLDAEDRAHGAEGALVTPLPAGRYRMRAFKGAEYKVGTAEFEIHENDTTRG